MVHCWGVHVDAHGDSGKQTDRWWMAMSARFRLTVGRWSVIQSIPAGSPVHMVTRAMVCTVGGAHTVSRATVAPTPRCCMFRVCVSLVLLALGICCAPLSVCASACWG